MDPVADEDKAKMLISAAVQVTERNKAFSSMDMRLTHVSSATGKVMGAHLDRYSVFVSLA